MSQGLIVLVTSGLTVEKKIKQSQKLISPNTCYVTIIKHFFLFLIIISVNLHL